MPVGRDGTERSTVSGAPAGRGNNHAAPAGAIGRRPGRAGPRAVARRGLLALGLLLAGAAGTAAQDLGEGNPLVQRGVPAEATAENAVVARDRALASGQRIAYERMAEQLGLPRSLSDGQIEAMVASLVIESERITPRGYSARITVNFRPPGATAARPALPAAPAASSGGPAVATLEAVARYRSLPEYVEITRRLGASPAVARVEVVTVSGDTARLRLGLRSQPAAAAAELERGGVLLGPAQDARPGEGWRVGLAGWR